jgi:hypothetical protein
LKPACYLQHHATVWTGIQVDAVPRMEAMAKGEMMATPTPPWTPEEENKLRELIVGAKSVEAIAKLLNRTPLAVRRRASMLRLPLRKIELRS